MEHQGLVAHPDQAELMVHLVLPVLPEPQVHLEHPVLMEHQGLVAHLVQVELMVHLVQPVLLEHLDHPEQADTQETDILLIQLVL